MMDAPTPEQLARVVRRLDPGALLVGSRVVQGGAAAQVIALEVRHADGQTGRLILRRYGDVALRQDPQIAEHEFRLLRAVHAAGLPAPRPFDYDSSDAILGRPYIVMEYVEGTPEFAPADPAVVVDQTAAQVAAIHRLDLAGLDVEFLPRIDDLGAALIRDRPTVLDEALGEGRVRATLEWCWPPAQRNATVLLHGDPWPGNLLWRDGRVMAVIDWEDAALGDPLADLADGRLEVLWAYGQAAMERFTAGYLALHPIDVGNLPCWDLWAALRPAGKLAEYAEGDAARERMLVAGHRAFVAQALAALAGKRS